ncbi:hypothetical protein AO369_0484 [Moraxella catarrhalis]|nr:hypothetical protein AO369_0484 [Moraxella catarrhalis]
MLIFEVPCVDCVIVSSNWLNQVNFYCYFYRTLLDKIQ